MIEFEDLKPGMEVWWCKAELSSNGYRLSTSSKPAKYIISDDFKPGDRYVKLIEPNRKSPYYPKTVYIKSYGSCVSSTFYESEIECKKAWNIMMLNFIDYLESNFQQKRKNLQNKMFKV